MVYVISDLHGQAKTFLRLLEQISFGEQDEMYILGDIIDRGPDFYTIYKYIIAHPNIHLLMGNHEKMMLDFVHLHGGDIVYREDIYYSTTLRKAFQLWVHNGGEVTYEQLSVLSETERKDFFKYCEALPYYKIICVNGQQFILSHGRPIFYDIHFIDNPTIEDYLDFLIHQDEILWCRDKMPQTIPDGYIVVHGHTPVQSAFGTEKITRYSYDDNIVNIDCGCAGARYLGCLRLDDMTEYYVECIK